MLLLIVVNNLIVYSQSNNLIIPDKKIDSFYCFGPTKTKQIVSQTYNLQQQEELSNQCDSEVLSLRKTISYKDSTINELGESLELGKQKDLLQEEKMASFEKQSEIQNKEIKKERRKNAILSIGGAGAGLLNIILTTIILVKQ